MSYFYFFVTFAGKEKIIMTYPNNFEEKIGFSAIRSLLQSYCLSPLGMAEVEAMQLSSDETIVSEAHAQTNEYRLLL